MCGVRSRRPWCGSAAFTLVEVVIALSVLAVALPAFFRVVQSAVQVGDVIDDIGRDFRRTEAAELYLRRFLASLPGATSVTQLETEDGPALEFLETYTAPGESVRAISGWSVRLEPRKQLNGLYALTLAARGTGSQGEPIEPEPLVLARDLETVTWRFFIETTNVWTDTLPLGVRPALIQAVLEAPGANAIQWEMWVRSRSATGYAEGE